MVSKTKCRPGWRAQQTRVLGERREPTSCPLTSTHSSAHATRKKKSINMAISGVTGQPKNSYVQTQALQGRVSLELFMSKDKATIHF